MVFANSSGSQTLQGSAGAINVNDNQYHQITVAYDPVTAVSTLYVDGEAEAAGTVASWTPANAQAFILGSQTGSNGAFALDEVYFYILTVQEAKKIIESIDISNARGYRDRTILEVFYATGIRKEELRNLKVQDVNLEEELLRVTEGKGGYDRVVPLSEVACRFIESYINGIRPQLLKGRATDFLFTSWRGKQLDKETLGTLVKKYARLAKVNKHVTCHIWRHTTATHLLKNDAKLRHVQAILGHKSLSTTERYLHLTINDLKEAHKKFHPREKNGS